MRPTLGNQMRREKMLRRRNSNGEKIARDYVSQRTEDGWDSSTPNINHAKLHPRIRTSPCHSLATQALGPCSFLRSLRTVAGSLLPSLPCRCCWDCRNLSAVKCEPVVAAFRSLPALFRYPLPPSDLLSVGAVALRATSLWVALPWIRRPTTGRIGAASSRLVSAQKFVTA